MGNTVSDVATPASGTTYYLGDGVQRPGDGDYTKFWLAAPRTRRLGQRGVGVHPDGAGRRGRSQRHLVECARARPRRRDHHADGRDDGRAPDPRRAGAAGGAPGGRRPADAGLGVGAGAVAGAGLRRAARSGLDAGDGRVYGDGDGRTTTTNPAVSTIYGIWVTLTLDAAPAAGATVTLAYAPPASNPVQDEAGNDAPAFTARRSTARRATPRRRARRRSPARRRSGRR